MDQLLGKNQLRQDFLIDFSLFDAYISYPPAE